MAGPDESDQPELCAPGVADSVNRNRLIGEPFRASTGRSESGEGGADVLGKQVEVEVCRAFGVERCEAKPLPPTEGG